MKKISQVMLVILLAAGLLAGCKSTPKPAPSGSSSPSSSSSGSSSSPKPSASSSSSSGQVKLGLAVITSISKSINAGEADGVAETDATVIAVSVDKDGKILSCAIDAVSAKVGFDKKGQLTAPTNIAFPSKNELGEKYGMKKASGIKKEWNEQAEAFAKYVEGMTVDEVKGIKVDEKNYPISPDLKSAVTISIGDFMKGLEKAVGSAKESGAGESDQLGVALETTASKSMSATPDKEGLVQTDIAVAAVTRDTAGAITGCVLDGVQSKIGLSNQGKITTDLTVNPQTKNEMKEAYGLKKASGIEKEWFEQAEAFAKYAVGKTPAEIKGIAVDDKGYAVPSDIKSSVTINITDFKAVIAKASGGA